MRPLAGTGSTHFSGTTVVPAGIAFDAEQGANAFRSATARRARALLLGGIVAIASPTGHAQVVLDGSLGRGGALAGPNFAVTADLGRQAGANLFHSFTRLDLRRGESAVFSGPAGIANIISRITGGAESSIDGLLRSTIPGADFFLFNPAGVAFGPNASIDVGGAFHVGSAHYLRLADGGRFDAANPGASSLTAAPPEAFGFLGGQGIVLVEGAYFVTRAGSGITIAGGGVGIGNGARLETTSAPIGIASVAGAGEVALGPGGIAGVTGGRGTIVLLDGVVISYSEDSRPSGAIRIVGGDVAVREGSLVSSINDSPLTGGGITVEATGTVLLSDGRISTNAYTQAGGSGGIRVSAPSVRLESASGIRAETNGPGHAGDVEIAATDFAVLGRSAVTTTSWDEGNAGAIRIDASRGVLIGDDGFVSARSNYDGDAGAITVRTDTLTIDDGFITSTVQGTGRSGSITLDVGELAMRDGFVSAAGSLIGSGDGGDVTVRASRAVTIDDSALSSVTSDGRGGNVFVSAPTLTIRDFGSITSSTFGAGDAGHIAIDVGELAMGSFGSVSASSSIDATGAGGSILIRASGGVTMDTGPFGGIIANTFGPGRGGSITIESPRVDLVDSQITATTQGAGDGGAITIRASERLVIDAARLLGGIHGDSSGAGRGGDIFIATPRLEIHRGGGIGASAAGTGPGGSITVEADVVTLDQGGQIRSFATGEGRGGIVDIRAGEISLREGSRILAFSIGSGAGGDVILRGDRSIRIVGEGETATTGITASSEGEGQGGSVRISTPSLEMSDAGYIFAGALASGRGGSVLIDAGDVTLSRLGFIDVSSYASGSAGSLILNATGTLTLTGASEQFSTGIFGTSSGSGAGGSLTLRAPRVLVDDGAVVSSVARSEGRGGTISIEAGEVAIRGGAAILASSFDAGRAGDVAVTATRSIVAEGGRGEFVSGIAAESRGSGDGGRIDLVAPQVRLRDGAQVTTQGYATGTAGSIRVEATDALEVVRGAEIATRTVQSDGGDITLAGLGVLHLTGGAIVTSVQGGDGNGGNIALSGFRHVVLNDSAIQANAFGGDGGNIAIDSGYFIASPRSVVEASSQLGVSGQVTVTAPVVDIGAGLGVLPAGFFDATRLLREACAARAGETGNTFVAVGRGTMPESAWGSYGSPAVRRDEEGRGRASPLAARPPASPCAGTPG